MSNERGINESYARIVSAASVFQKGLYHLFVLEKDANNDIVEKTLRTYQALFQLCLSQYLLDRTELISKIRPSLVAHCKDPRNPTSAEIDPAVAVIHAKFENGPNGWKGHPEASVLCASSRSALSLIYRSTKARHNLIYKPQMLIGNDGKHWEDCSTQDLIGNLPNCNEVIAAYTQFVRAVIDEQSLELTHRYKVEQEVKARPEATLEILQKNSRWPWADSFLHEIFDVYEDKKDQRPTETILLTYARMLNGNNELFLQQLCGFRNNMFQLREIEERFRLGADRCLGKV